jgi:hypothetical protein
MAMGTGITSSLDKQYKQALQAAYNLPMDQAVQKIMSITSLPEVIRLSAVKEIQSMNQGAQAQAPQGTVKDKILSAAAPPQQGMPPMPQGMPPMPEGMPPMPQGEMPQGMPQGMPPMPQGMPPMPEGAPPMPPQGMAAGGDVHDYGIASLSGERGDEYALDQGLGSLSANIDYAGGGIVSFAGGDEVKSKPRSREILEQGLNPYQGWEDGSLTADLRRAEDDPEALKDIMGMRTRDEIFAAKGLSHHISRDMMQHPTLFKMLTEPMTGDMGSEEFRSLTGGPSRPSGWFKNPSLPKGAQKPASIEEKTPSYDELMLKLQSLYGDAPDGIGRVSVPRVGKDYPAAMQIKRTPEFKLEQRLAQEAEADKAYGVNRNLLAEQRDALNKDIEALQGRTKQATWSSLGKRAAQAWDVQPGQGAPTLMSGLANLFGGMTEDIEAENRAVRGEKQELLRYQREFARADNLERQGRANEAQQVRTANELTRRGEENKQRELKTAREQGIFAANREAAMQELDANTQIDIANAQQRGAYDRARLTAMASAKEKGYELQKMALDAAKSGRTDPEIMTELYKNIISDPFTKEEATAMLKAKGDEPTEQNLAQAMQLIARQKLAQISSDIISSQENQTRRMLGRAGLNYGSEQNAEEKDLSALDSGGL